MSGAKIANVEVSAAALAGYALAEGLGNLAELGASKLQQRGLRLAAQAQAAQREEAQLKAVLARRVRLEAIQASYASAQQSYGVGALEMPQRLSDASGGDFSRWCAQTDAQLDRAEQALSEAIAKAAARGLPAGDAGALVTDLAAHRTPTPAEQELSQTLARVLGRLATNISSEHSAEIERAAARVNEATSFDEATAALADVRIRVHDANNEAAVRQERAIAAARAQLEQQYVAETVTTALTELGYEVSEGFETLTAHRGEAFVTRDDWADHAVKMRIDTDNAGTRQLRVAMVRTREASSVDDRRRDAEREEQWCDSFAELRTRLNTLGVQTEVTWAIDKVRLPVVGNASGASIEHDQQRERER